MKTFLLLITMLYSFSSFSQTASYRCQIRLSTLAMDLTLAGNKSHLWLMDRLSHSVIFHAHTHWEEKKVNTTRYHFSPSNGDVSRLTFKNTDLETLPDRLEGHYDGRAGGMTVYDKFHCLRRD
jgi:hypothetical protein